MSPFDKGKLSIFDRVKAFTVEGLANAHVSASNAASARSANQPIPWKTGAQAAREAAALDEELFGKYMPADGSNVSLDTGLRLLAPVGWNSNAVIDGIVGLPGYQAGCEFGADAAFKSFSIDPSWPVHLLRRRVTPAFPWPIPINAPDDLAHAVEQSRAQMRGFVLPSSTVATSPSIAVDIVDLSSAGLTGSFLAIRFLRTGTKPSRLEPELSLAKIGRDEPLVLLPLQGRTAQAVLTDFLYELAHDLPVDEAAWKTVRAHNYGQPPVVLASRGFLGQAQLSDNIPGLQAKLNRLPADSPLDISEYDLLKFNPGGFRGRDLSRPTVGAVRNILSQSNDFDWSHESDSAEGLLAVTRAITAREQEMASRSGGFSSLARAGIDLSKVLEKLPSSAILGGLLGTTKTLSTKTFDGGGLDLESILKSVLAGATPRTDAPPTAAPPDEPAPPIAPAPPQPPDRYTNVEIFDVAKLVSNKEALFVGRPYFFDVSIGTERKGVTAASDSPQARLGFVSIADATIWVAISDESPGDNNPDGGAFEFDKRFESFVLPTSGASKGRARFKVTPKPLAFPRGSNGQLGIRLYHKLNLIDHIQLDLRVEPRVGAVTAGGQNPEIKATFRPIEPPDAANAVRALNISISRARMPFGEDGYRFAIVVADKEGSGKPVLSATKKISETVLNDYVAKFRDILLKTALGPSLGRVELNVNERDDLMKELLLLGTIIVTQLFDYTKAFLPTDLFLLGKMIGEVLPETSIVQISLGDGAEDFIFPWQILTLVPYTDRDKPAVPLNLWGFRFVIEVKRRGDGVDTRPPEARSHVPLRVAYGRWNFANEPDHHRKLKEIIATARTSSRLIDPVMDTQQDFLDALKAGGSDLVYVYAHGHAAAPSTPAGLRFRDKARLQIEELAQKIEKNPLGLSTTEFEEQKKTLEQFRKVTEDGADSLLTLTLSGITLTSLVVEMPPGGPRLADAPIVILNTCESAQIWNALDDSFISFFLERGARAVLGSETTIPVVLADVFGREVLEAMFKGSSLGEAVSHARLSLLNEKQNPLGLCYSIYGDADARLFQTSPQPSTGRPVQ